MLKHKNESGWRSPDAQRIEAARRLLGTAAVIVARPRLLPNTDLGTLVSSISQPLIRAREALRVGKTPNSSTPRHAKTVFQRLRWKQQYNNGQHQRERPDPRLGLRVHDQAPVHGYKTTSAVAAAPGLSSTHRTS